MSEYGEVGRDRTLSWMLRAWSLLTALFLAVNGALFLGPGRPVFQRLIQEGPLSQLPLTLASVAIVWCGLGASLLLLRRRAFRSRHGVTLVSAFCIVVLYANVLRERQKYGDVMDYIRAAHDLVRHAPFNPRYLYPPFLATVLAPLLPLGDMTVGGICWLGNLLALGLFVVLLRWTLNRYGFGSRPSALVTVLFTAVNAPILRTLGYVQVNLHVANLILITVLAYPRRRLLSALALALAIHLKASPAVLVLPFLLGRDWRWIAWFGAMVAVLAFVTVLPFGWQPFAGFLHNVGQIYVANPISFRENSVDSLVRSCLKVFGMPLDSAVLPITLLKTIILALVLATMSRAIRRHLFSGGDRAGAVVLDAVPVLLLFMLLGSPLVWEHHPVFVALPYLLMLKVLEGPTEYGLYGLAYFLEYLLPTFDFFPWSFGRLLSPLILLGLIHRATVRTAADASAAPRWLAGSGEVIQ